MSWGSDTNDESKPNWTWLTTQGRGNTAPKSANVIATSKGWELRWPWGLETLVAIGGLDTAIGNATIAALYVSAPSELPNIAAQSLRMLVAYNEPVAVSGTPTIRAITSDAAPANVVLSYQSSDSDPANGKLVFANLSVSLAAAVGVGSGDTAVVNASSTLTGFDGITDLGNANAVANAIPAGVTATWNIVSALPMQSNGAFTNAPLDNAAGQILTFVAGWNRAITLINSAAVMSIRAIASGDANIANAVLTYTGTTNGTHLTFQSSAIDLAALGANVTFTVNSTSTLVGFNNITDLAGNVTGNTITTANSITLEF